MVVESCIPIIPSADLERSLRLWSEMQADGKLIFCKLRRCGLSFMLNRRAGTPTEPEDYEGIQLYWAPSDILRHVWHNMPASIYQANIRRLHECIDKNNFK
jgi:hypothetical protein